MATEHEREVLKEFIEVYRENPCLWDVRSELYRNKGMKHEAWGLLTGILKKMDPNANVCTTKKKVDNLRSVYFRELKKVRASELRATDDEEIFQPNLWYFKLMGFLGSKEWGPRRATLDCTDPLQACPVQETTEDAEIPEVETDLEIPTPKKKLRKTQSSDRRKIKSESINRVQTFVKPLHYAEPRYMESKISETFGRVEQKAKSNSFGIYVGEQLEQISSFQRTVAEKLISEVLFLAKTGNLSCDSKIDSPKQNGPDIMLSSPIMVEVETENEKDGERILLKELLTEGRSRCLLQD